MAARVAGHTLRSEGAPHVVDETGNVVRVHNSWGGIGGFGRGLCACGELSDLLDSAHQRKAWHRLHKKRVTEPVTVVEPAHDAPSCDVAGRYLDGLEQVARDVPYGGPWRADSTAVWTANDNDPDEGPTVYVNGGVHRNQRLTALHIATFDPPTVLALIERVRAAETAVARAEAATAG